MNNNYPKELRIKHDQQRLLLLHHANKCKVVGPCPVTLDCADMKKLWVHMRTCSNANCQIPYCFSSRSILQHHRNCKNPKCPVCGPVRATVAGSNPLPLASPPPPPPQRRQKSHHQLLYLLNHNQHCKAAAPCSQTPYCDQMKELWKHMKGCPKSNCEFKDCKRGKWVLKHYHSCKDPKCKICGSVRATKKREKK